MTRSYQKRDREQKFEKLAQLTHRTSSGAMSPSDLIPSSLSDLIPRMLKSEDPGRRDSPNGPTESPNQQGGEGLSGPRAQLRKAVDQEKKKAEQVAQIREQIEVFLEGMTAEIQDLRKEIADQIQVLQSEIGTLKGSMGNLHEEAKLTKVRQAQIKQKYEELREDLKVQRREMQELAATMEAHKEGIVTIEEIRKALKREGATYVLAVLGLGAAIGAMIDGVIGWGLSSLISLI